MKNTRYPALLTSSPIAPKYGKLFPKSKKVAFASEVQIKHDDHTFISAIQDVRDRTRDIYFRPSKTYKPGDHACPPDSIFLDTSGTIKEPGDINNVKIFVTDDQDAFRSLQVDVKALKDSVGEYQGLVGMHALKRDIFACMVAFMKMTYGDSWTKEDLVGLMSKVDRITVLIDEETGGVVDIFPLDGSDEDDAARQSKKKKGKAVASGDWTCLKECLSISLPFN